MGFKLPNGARKYYEAVNARVDGGIKFKTMFDIYYLCLMLGFDKAKIGLKKNLESGDFIDYYPEQYADKNKLIAGLLIDAEMRHNKIITEDKQRVENLMINVIDQHSLTGLNSTGIDYLNLYAVTGIEEILKFIAITTELETFLVQYFELLNVSVI